MSGRVRYTKTEDEWILSNIKMSVAEEYEAFIKRFGKSRTLSSFKTRRAKLNNRGLTHTRYTLEEDEWIKANYSKAGAENAFKGLCERFGDRHTIASFKSRCRDLGLNVTNRRWREACLNNGTHENVPIGTIKKRGRGQNWIKIGNGTDGWIPLSQYLIDVSKNKNMVVIHLDGNKANDDEANLRIVSRKVLARMSKQGFWSQNPVITETGIRCCELQEALSESEKFV